MQHRFLLAMLLVGACVSGAPDVGGPAAQGGADASPGIVPDGGVATADGAAATRLDTVFLIVMENKDWSSIAGNPAAPYLNSLLSSAAHASSYWNPPGLHPSEPNYIWFEAGSNLGVTTDAEPASNAEIGRASCRERAR